MCIETGSQTLRGLDCKTCEDRQPEILKENIDVFDLWDAAGTQWRSGGFSVVGLDYPAVYKIAEVIGIEETPILHQKLRILESLQLRKWSKKEAGK
jgi:hypothetical protein